MGLLRVNVRQCGSAGLGSQAVTPPAAPASRSRDWAILAALFAMNFASTSQVFLVAPILPRIGEALAIPQELRGTLISAYGVFAGLFALLAGPVSDRYGRRFILLVGTTWMTTALVLHLFAGSYATMLAVRALAGMAGGILGGVAVAYVGDYFPYERRGLANGWVMSGFALGQVLGIPLGAVMAERYGFRSPFLALAVFMGLASLLTWTRVPQPNVPLAPDLSFGSALAKYRALLLRRVTAAAAASYFVMFFGVGEFIAYLPTWLEGTFHVSADQVAGMFAVGGIAAVFANPLAGKLSDRVGRRVVILTASALFAAVAGLTPALITSFTWAYPVFFFAMASASVRSPPIQSLFSALVPAHERGSLMSLSSFGGQTGFAIGGAAAGVLYGRAGFGAVAGVACAATVAVTVLIWAALPEPRGEPTDAAH